MARTKKKIQAAQLKHHLMRSNTSLLLTSVMLFQFVAMLLLSLKKSPFDTQALLMAIALPSLTYIVSMGASRLWPVDRALLIMTLFLCSVSLVTLQDISRSPITPRNQAVYMCGGLVAMAMGIEFVRRVRNWEKWVLPLAAASLLFLLTPMMPVIGGWNNGARNWINLPGGQSVQPSEFVKLALIVIIAAGLSSKPRFKQCLPYLALAGVMCGILLMERDLGALLLYFLTTVCMYYAATGNWTVTLGGLGIGAACAAAAYKLFPYVAKRVEMFINPWSDPQDSGYQIVQALIAIGSGGAFGMGLGLGYPRNIPLYHSDFVFAALCEEFGLVFAIGLLCVYVLIIMRGVSVAMNARTSFHGLVAFGYVVLLGFQTFIIVGGNIKLLPLTGVTLPFVSAGGSSVVAMMGGMGLLLGVSSLNAHDEVEDLKRLQWREGVDGI